MEKPYEARRLARINATLLSACQPQRALHLGYDPTYSFVTHQSRLVPITRKSGRFLPKDWPREKNWRVRSARQFTWLGRDKTDTANSIIFVTRMALRANLPMWPIFR